MEMYSVRTTGSTGSCVNRQTWPRRGGRFKPPKRNVEYVCLFRPANYEDHLRSSLVGIYNIAFWDNGDVLGISFHASGNAMCWPHVKQRYKQLH